MTQAITVDALGDELQPSRVSVYLMWAIVILAASLIGWAWWAQVDETATAGGRVIATRQLQIVSNLEGGTVKAILVKPGARVVVGQPLIELDNTQFSADFGKTNDSYQALTARAARLRAELEGHAPHFPTDLASSSPRLVATEMSLYNARLAGIAAATAVEQAKADQAVRGLAQAEAEASSRSASAALADREVAMIAPLVAKGIEPTMELIREQSAQEQARGAATSAVMAVSRARAAVAEAQSSVRSVRNKYRAESTEQLTQVQAELIGHADALPALQDRVHRAVLRAPTAGIVNRVLVTTVGGSVRPGEPLVEIVPADDTLLIETQVRPADIAFIHNGQRAMVKLTAYDYYVYGGLSGVVEQISPDAMVNERSGESFFTIRVRTDRAALTAPDGTTLPIGTGMVAQVDILGHKRSILSYLLTPISRLRDNAFREK